MTWLVVHAQEALDPPMSNLLALDQASHTTGWAIFINEELKDWGHLTTNQTEIGERLVSIRNFIINKVQEWNIDTIAFEDIQLQTSVGNNVKTFKVLANVYGVVLMTAVELNKNYEVIPSSTWKSTLQIKGRTRLEQKRNAQEFVLQRYNIKATQDECDSICIGTCMIKTKITNVKDGFDWS